MNLGQPVKNRFNVTRRQWAKWSNHARKIFNSVMLDMRPSMQFLFLHPDCPPMKKDHWQTTRWNAAFTAASAANGQRGTLTNGDRIPPTVSTKKKARKHR